MKNLKKRKRRLRLYSSLVKTGSSWGREGMATIEEWATIVSFTIFLFFKKITKF